MAAPSEEYDYEPVTQFIKCGRWTLSFGFYDHSMCGSCMFSIFLQELDSGEPIVLRQDGPCEDGSPSVFPEEAMAILEHAEPTLTVWHMLSLLAATNSELGSVEFMQQVEARFQVSSCPSPLWKLRVELTDTRGGPPMLFDMDQAYPLPIAKPVKTNQQANPDLTEFMKSLSEPG